MQGVKSVVAQLARKPAAIGMVAVFDKRSIARCGAACCRRRFSGGGGGIATEWQGERQPGSGGDELQRGLSPEEVRKCIVVDVFAVSEV